MKPRILFITTDWNTPYRIATGEYGGIGYYRAHGPAKALRSAGYKVDVMGHEFAQGLDKNNLFEGYRERFKPYDMVVVKQIDTSNGGKFIGACKSLKIPIVMDMDDLIVDIDPDNPAYEDGYKAGEAKRALALASLSMVDGLFVSTQPLKDEYETYLKKSLNIDMPIHVLPNCCDPTLWTKIKRDPKDKNIVLGWQGSVTHNGDLALVIPTIEKLMDKYDNLFLSLTGGVTQETYDEMFANKFKQDALNRVIINRGTPSFKNFPEYLGRHKWDIGIIPLRDTRFTRCKSHIKWLENSLVGVASIASNVYPYAEPIHGTNTIVDGETGFLVNEPDEWEAKIELLYHDAKARRYMARDARYFVEQNWKYGDHIAKWNEAIASVMNEGSKSLT